MLNLLLSVDFFLHSYFPLDHKMTFLPRNTLISHLQPPELSYLHQLIGTAITMHYRAWLQYHSPPVGVSAQRLNGLKPRLRILVE